MSHNPEYKKWWRHIEGNVSFDNGFHYADNPDYWHFDMDPEWCEEFWGTYQLLDNDERIFHVDDLFDSEDAAKDAAIKYCEDKLDELMEKMRKLAD